LDNIRFEKKKLEEEMSAISLDYKKMSSEYDILVEKKSAVLKKVGELTQKIEQLKSELERTTAEKKMIANELKSVGNKTKLRDEELSKIRKLLSDKSSEILSLSKRYDQLKQDLESAVSEKFKLEYAHRSAQREYERIKKDIETFLEHR